jgi:hypothetical protein
MGHGSNEQKVTPDSVTGSLIASGELKTVVFTALIRRISVLQRAVP